MFLSPVTLLYLCVSYRWVRTALLKFYALQPFVHRQVERDKVSFLSGKFSNLISPSELLPPSTFPQVLFLMLYSLSTWMLWSSAERLVVGVLHNLCTWSRLRLHEAAVRSWAQLQVMTRWSSKFYRGVTAKPLSEQIMLQFKMFCAICCFSVCARQVRKPTTSLFDCGIESISFIKCEGCSTFCNGCYNLHHIADTISIWMTGKWKKYKLFVA